MEVDMKLKNISIFIAIAAAMAGGTANAGPVSASGIMRSYYLSGGANFGFRISLYQNGVDQLSGCNANFAYINTTDDNYQSKVAGLMLAYSTKANVVLTGIVTDSQGFCRIGDYSVAGQ
jgi:hypothetical protein